MYCLDAALQLQPSHVRALDSRGQVYTLTQRWQEAEGSFRAAAEHAVEPDAKGQAMYCVGTALHTQVSIGGGAGGGYRGYTLTQRKGQVERVAVQQLNRDG